MMEGIQDVVVTGPDSPSIENREALSGREICVRPSSSYHESLVALNRELAKAGRPPVKICKADESLEDEDVLQMVDAGILPATVAKLPIARFWAQIYDRLTVHENLVLRSDGQIAWALRKNTPGIAKVVNDFVRTHRAGTLFGNVLLKRYVGSAERLKNPTSEAEMRRFRDLAAHLRKYAGKYDFDWILVGAQAYQESGLDQGKRSRAGAVGVMQIKPETAADPNVGIRNVENVENNVHAGVKYLRFLVDRYFQDEGIDRLNRGLFAIASYNAGPARVTQLRKKAKTAGLDPNRWFGNVEVIAAREIGRETVDYVSNIYKYYVAYKATVGRKSGAAGAPRRKAA